jgi:hypothetical protein
VLRVLEGAAQQPRVHAVVVGAARAQRACAAGGFPRAPGPSWIGSQFYKKLTTIDTSLSTPTIIGIAFGAAIIVLLFAVVGLLATRK